MPNRYPIPVTEDEPRGPTHDGPRPDRSTEDSPSPPITGTEDNKNPNDPPLDPALLPIGDPAGMA